MSLPPDTHKVVITEKDTGVIRHTLFRSSKYAAKLAKKKLINSYGLVLYTIEILPNEEKVNQ